MRFILSGYGNMGKMIEEVLKCRPGTEIAGRADVDDKKIFSGSEACHADVIVDFSHPEMFDDVTQYAQKMKIPLVCGTTGLSDEQKSRLVELGKSIPVVYSTNFSYGIAVMRKALTVLAEKLRGDWDMEITETHHRRKADAPSGTALSLIDCMDPDNQYDKLYGRVGICGERSRKEIGVHSLRGGTEVGEHTVTFFGTDETLSITHRAASRRIFAEGAVKVAQRLAQMPAGFYTFDGLFSD